MQHYVARLSMVERKTYELKQRAEAMESTRRRITEAAVALHESLARRGPASASSRGGRVSIG